MCHVALPETERDALAAELAPLGTLADVIMWGLRAAPPRVVVAVVVQDEYTHDIVLPWRDGRYLVFDTT
jgi:hypothetical protein